MMRLMRYLKGYEKEATLAPLFKMLEAFFDLLVPLVVADIINNGISSGNLIYCVTRVLMMILLAAVGLASSVTAQYFAAKSSVGFATKLRQDTFDHIQKLSYKELDQIGSGTLITRLTSDINQVQSGLNMALRLLLRSPFIVFGSMIMSFTIDYNCALVFVAAVPALAVVVFGITFAVIPLFKKVQAKLDEVTEHTRENLNGVRVIRAFCKEDEEINEFDDKNNALTKINEFTSGISSLMNPLTYVMINIATIYLIKEGALRVSLGSIQQGDVVALYNYMAQMIVELIKMASLSVTINKGLACAARVANVLDEKSSIKFADRDAETTEIGTVEFDKVYFSYSKDGDPALENISFKAEKGDVIGIIGGTGSGKSSLVNLISRFYDVDSGVVKLDGVDVKSYTEATLRERIGVVPQKAVLFAGTVRDNMKWGNENATDEEIWDALKIAQADGVVEGKENKLDHQIEQNGRNLSGGQKQRLTIARALVKKPEFLILDDSASALDFATDAALRHALRGISGSTTIFIVSQRTSSIMEADQILVLDDGKLVGKGTHAELLKNSHVYQEIYYSQFPEQRKENARSEVAQA
ncbi:MAG: ABC transporter ATP-binding protein/permease [Lachnospiraceae bacterium]|nr:ABC transporter ATP-binding protein/permease [Lachnospiraceae bacterium]